MSGSLRQNRHVVTRVVSEMEIGGVQRGIIETLSFLDRDQLSAQVLCLRERGPLAEMLQKIDVGCLLYAKNYQFSKVQFGGLAKYSFQVGRILKKQGTSILHIHQANPSLALILAGKFARVPCIVLHHHSIYKEHYWETLSPARLAWERRAAGWADAIIAVSQAVADCTHEVLGVPREKIVVIPNGTIPEESDRVEWAKAAPPPEIPPGHKLVVGVGRVVEDKCWEDFIDAAKQLKDRAEKVRFWLIGDSPKGNSTMRELQKRVQSHGLEGTFQFLGFRMDVPRLLAKADVGVLCSRREGWGNAALEYMTAGVPVVVSNFPSASEIVRDQETGLIVPVNDPAALAAAIGRVLEEPGLADSLKIKGRERAKEFSWEKTERGYEALYRRVLESKGKWSVGG